MGTRWDNNRYNALRLTVIHEMCNPCIDSRSWPDVAMEMQTPWLTGIVGPANNCKLFAGDHGQHIKNRLLMDTEAVRIIPPTNFEWGWEGLNMPSHPVSCALQGFIFNGWTTRPRVSLGQCEESYCTTYQQLDSPLIPACL